MRLHTASEAISLARKLGEDSAKFYVDLSQKYAKDKDIFLSFAAENRKNVVQIDRVYYGVISDAIEGCFAFNINAVDYTFETELIDKVSYSEALYKAVEIEKKMVQFYLSAAEQSKSLLADLPRAFALIAKKRGNREPQLSALLEKEA